VLRRSLVFTTAVLGALALAASALALTVTVRVEGATRTLFGAAEPSLTVFTGTLAADDGTPHELAQPTALGALEAASREGEFFYNLKAASFGLYVDQIGRHPAAGSSGWVYKVNGVVPPVGAADYVLEEGDALLWYHATLSDQGGPATLELDATSAGGRRCYRAVARDDAGKTTFARGVVYVVDGRRVRSASGRLCPAGRWHAVRVTKAGAVPSRLYVR
jgi:hypothetical protein